MKLELPLQYIKVTQYFGENAVNFYSQLGMTGHNGIDFLASIGTPFFAVFDGYVEKVWTSDEGGLSLKLISTDGKWMAFYCHLSKVIVEEGQRVKALKKLGLTGNSGKYTTGAHLHFGLYPIPENKNNGYNGAIDPYPYMTDLNEVPVDKRYGQPRQWIEEWKLIWKNSWVHKQLITMRGNPISLTDREVKGLVYGKWDWHTIFDPAMYSTWTQITKPDYDAGKRPRIIMNK